jgi:phosphatidylserine/phosphatidylglycerophosphate/cardiolipin synthase-like enzyme
LEKLARSGVKVRLLTNSLAATDESAVHAGYAKHRLALLQAGVRIYELMPTAMKNTLEHTGRFGGELILGPSRENLRAGPQPHLRGLIQFRPSIRAAEHRDGPGD